MKKRVSHISLLVVLVAATLAVLDRLYTFALLNNQNLKLSNVGSSPTGARILFHGPCEPLWMISPARIDPVTGVRSYNLALSHSDFADNFLHLYLYLKSNPAPEHLFLYATPESFDRRYNTFNTFRFSPYVQDDTVAGVVRENDPAYGRWMRIPFMRYAYYSRRVNFQVIQGLKHYLSKRRTAYYPDGFEPPAQRVWGNHAGDFVRLYGDNIHFKADSLRVKYFQVLIRFAKSRGISVHLYESPVLRESLRAQANRDELLRFIDSLAAREDIRYVRFEVPAISDRRENYISPLSLSMKGLALFNDTLARYIARECVKR